MDKARERARGLLKKVLSAEEWEWYEKTGSCRFPSTMAIGSSRFTPRFWLYHCTPGWIGTYIIDAESKRLVSKRFIFPWVASSGTPAHEFCFEDRVLTYLLWANWDPKNFHFKGCDSDWSVEEHAEVMRIFSV